MAHLGAGATLGLDGVLSLPSVFVFRTNWDDPHPFPWMRAMLSFALGRAVSPQPFWERMETTWRCCYPAEAMQGERRLVLDLLLETMPEFVGLLVNHRPKALGGRTVPEALGTSGRSAEALSGKFRVWRSQPQGMREARPSEALAVLGHARATGRLSPEGESKAVMSLMRAWALRRSLGVAEPAPPVNPGRQPRRLR
jgi:hypothetical protein